MPKDTFYLTTPIYYPNDVPHIGHAYTTVAADFICRHRRLAGEKVYFLTGTDEHGEKVLKAAQEQGKDAQDWLDEMIPQWTQLWSRLRISYDDFIRTTEQRHMIPVQKLLQTLKDKGWIYLGQYEGPYCVACETFYRPSELKNGLCPIHEIPVKTLEEENYFFKLSELQDPLLKLYEERPEFVQPEIRRNEVVSFVRGGLDDLSISRTSFTWGVPIPWDTKHVMYVWIDALQNYITAAGYGADPDLFARMWPADYHLIGKDILRQHAVIWPAFLLAAEIELPKTVFAHGYLTVGGKKMSKTNLTGISPHLLLDTFGPDGYRYHFLREGVFGQDGSFSWEAMTNRYNADLANDLGNLVSRSLGMVGRYFDGKVPEPEAMDEELSRKATEAFASLDGGVRGLDFAFALDGVLQFVKATNHYIDAAAPWKLAKEDAQRAALGTVLYNALEAIRVMSVLIAAAMPDASSRIRNQIGLFKEVSSYDQDLAWGQLESGADTKRGESIFPRIEAEAEA